jgi:SNF2 family DNA or RNA helicase
VSLKLAEQHPDYEVTLVWGGLSEAEFNERIARATKEGVRSILVANMSAIETGLNRLVCFSRGILAELYYRPATVSQALARFHRLTSRFPVSFDVLFCPDTLDSRIYSSLSNKLEDIDKIIGNGDADKQLQDLDKSDWQADLRADLED